MQHTPVHPSPPRGKTMVRNDGVHGDPASSTQVAHTLTACTRCRQRKTRCDPALPRCTPCERTNSVCEYYDAAKGKTLNRNYVVWLQHKVRALEDELDKVENEDSGDDPEALMGAANVRIHDASDSKYLGPSSGIAITRLVMQLAKQFTDAKSIKEIVPPQRARQIKELYSQEQAKPTSKVYPLISDVPAVDLPNRALTNLLVQLYKLKVQPMYPALHEPKLDHDIEAVYCHGDQATPYQNFVCRMVIAISLQKMDTQYAGLADSYYLAALQHLEHVVQPMDLNTLQCFALMAEYSLLTPTRTAIYYIVGIAVRLVQALGYNEEKMITRGKSGGKADPLEIDLRRRAFWCIFVMECGLAHSLGRPAILATSQDHLDVGWFETCDDKYITSEGIDPLAPRPTLKKWIGIHFFKMRLLQLEIRRKLYQKKRDTPKDDSDPWFQQMDAKLSAWRDAAPSQDEGHGLDKIWFIGRYNTMVVFLYRPSPQVARPSLDAAMKCFDACEYNIYMQREQITKKNVDLTWIFTQSIFMAINTMLWSLSYVEVRRRHSRTSVERHLEVAMDAIQLASERWPGVASAVQLYHNLIIAIMKIYEKDGDVPISATTPSDAASPAAMFPDAFNRSTTTSPVTVSSQSVATPPERPPQATHHNQNQTRGSIEQPPPMPYQSDPQEEPHPLNTAVQQTPPSTMQTIRSEFAPTQQSLQQRMTPQQNSAFDPTIPFNPLPEWNSNLTPGPNWASSPQHSQMQYTPPAMPTQTMYNNNANLAYANPVFDPSSQGYPFPATMDAPLDNGYSNEQYMWDLDTGFGSGLTQDQQTELMHSLETDGMEDIQSMITATLSAVAPKSPGLQLPRQ
ncbi:Positive regulator of purine utilization [Acrodontium crateriforme]|uniref:Positive regulator of purine utilization n=1 Tax=Acrodontium crateriforme TaxID=150365 RepID=A0AAQ3R8L2_9PEZI|nr:Positive regulator of purine utilization [Acrodontium crateriforme]